MSVGDKVLTTEEVALIIPPGVNTKEDSIIIADDYVRRWVHRQVMLQKAQMNLTEEEIDINNAIEEYRASLLVERYQRKVIEQKFKPNITQEDIETYYNETQEKFPLNENIMKGMFAIIPKSIKDIKVFRSLIQKDIENNYSEIEQYLFKKAPKSILSFDKWITVSSVNQYIPSNIPFNELQALRQHKIVEMQDDKNYYFFLAVDHRLTDDKAPIEFVNDKIYSILLNKKKIEFIKKLDTDIFKEASENNQIKYYNK